MSKKIWFPGTRPMMMIPRYTTVVYLGTRRRVPTEGIMIHIGIIVVYLHIGYDSQVHDINGSGFAAISPPDGV